jgi:hypothetical protein
MCPQHVLFVSLSVPDLQPVGGTPPSGRLKGDYQIQLIREFQVRRNERSNRGYTLAPPRLRVLEVCWRWRPAVGDTNYCTVDGQHNGVQHAEIMIAIVTDMFDYYSAVTVISQDNSAVGHNGTRWVRAALLGRDAS